MDATGRRLHPGLGTYGNPQLKAFGLELGKAINEQIWFREENGFAFNPKCGWSDTSTYTYNYPAYSMVMSVWDLLTRHQARRRVSKPGLHRPKRGTHAPVDDQGPCFTRTTHTNTVNRRIPTWPTRPRLQKFSVMRPAR